MKKQIGIFSFTCDEGCSIYLIEIFNKKLLEWLPSIELRYFLSVKDRADFDYLDIALIEGVASNEKEKKEIEEIRKKAKTVIAMGTCAVTGVPSAQRNNFNENQMAQIKEELEKYNYLPKALTLKEIIKVDDQILGCPIDEKKFIETFEKYLNL